MKASEKKDFAKLLGDVMAFYRQDVTPFALGVWWMACESFDFERVSKAMTAHALDAERGQFAPKPADIVRALRGTQGDRALVAWGKVYGAMSSVGAYQSVAFDDPAIHLAVEDIGGWVSLCRSQLDELPFVQRRFCDAYRMHATRPETPHPARLIGESETVNQAAKMTDAQRKQLERTMLIGDETAAKHVIATGGARRHEITTLVGLLPQVPRLEDAA